MDGGWTSKPISIIIDNNNNNNNNNNKIIIIIIIIIMIIIITIIIKIIHLTVFSTNFSCGKCSHQLRPSGL